jgi:hypothetical protein
VTRWLRELVPLRVWPKMISAAHYNCVRLALKRLGCPLRHELQRPALILRIDEDLWAGMAPWDEELPLLAWTDFDTRRSGLDQPVACRLHVYHAQAGLLMGMALEALNAGLKVRLDAQRAAGLGSNRS